MTSRKTVFNFPLTLWAQFTRELTMMCLFPMQTRVLFVFTCTVGVCFVCVCACVYVYRQLSAYMLLLPYKNMITMV